MTIVDTDDMRSKTLGCFFEAEDAAMFVAMLGQDATIFSPNGRVLWVEGQEYASAAESYDVCAEIMQKRSEL